MDEFAVWAAYYVEGNLVSEPMEGIRVYRRDGLWMYYDLQMWQEGDWHFEAFYPLPSELHKTEPVLNEDALEVNFTAVHSGSQTGLEGLTVNYYYGPTASYDLMTAEADRSYPAQGGNAVQFTFSHLLSRVSIAVKAATDNVTLNSLTFAGMSVLGEYNTPESGTDKWRLLTSIEELQNVAEGSFPADMSQITNPLPSGGTSVPVISDLLLIPQTPGDDANGLDPIEITATYSVGGAAPEEKTLSLPAAPAWQPGRHYRYTLTLAGADVTLSVSVVDWSEKSFSVEF